MPTTVVAPECSENSPIVAIPIGAEGATGLQHLLGDLANGQTRIENEVGEIRRALQRLLEITKVPEDVCKAASGGNKLAPIGGLVNSGAAGGNHKLCGDWDSHPVSFSQVSRSELKIDIGEQPSRVTTSDVVYEPNKTHTLPASNSGVARSPGRVSNSCQSDYGLPIRLRKQWKEPEACEGPLTIVELDVVDFHRAKNSRSRPRSSVKRASRARHLCDVMHPTGYRRSIWNVLCVVFIIYDMITIPLLAFDLRISHHLAAFEWSGTLFWTLDVAFMFRTGFFVGTTVEMNPRRIAIRYMKTWFIVDLFVVIVEWLSRAGYFPSSMTLFRLPRAFRGMSANALRAVRLIRLLKVYAVLHHIKDEINSNLIQICYSMFVMTLLLAFTVHITTCIWYAIGTRRNGWTYDDNAHSESNPTPLFWYLASSRWVIAQLNGRTDLNEKHNLFERGFTCVVGVILAVVLQSLFVSVLTSTIMELGERTSESRLKAWKVNKFLEYHGVSARLATAVKMHMDALHKDNSQPDAYEMDVLNFLPQQIRTDLLVCVRFPTLQEHSLCDFISTSCPPAMRSLCAGLERLGLENEAIVFGEGDLCNNMFFVQKGTLTYDTRCIHRSQSVMESLPSLLDIDDINATSVGAQQYLCEMALWIEWSNRGRLMSIGYSTLYGLPWKHLSQVLQVNVRLYRIVLDYAKKYVEILSEENIHSDIVEFKIFLNDSGRSDRTISAQYSIGDSNSTTPRYGDARN